MVAVISGASRGLGLALAQVLAETSDFNVLLTARDGAAAVDAVSALRAQGVLGVEAYAAPLDVQDRAHVADFSNFMAAEYGAVDLLINNAAVCHTGWDCQTVRDSLRINVLGPLALTRALLPAMSRRRRGHVVNVSSGDGELVYLNTALQQELNAATSVCDVLRILGRAAPPRNAFGPSPAHGPTPAYAISKAALNALTRIVATELPPPGRTGVRISSVCPGDVLTRMCSDPNAAVLPAVAAVDVAWLAVTGVDDERGDLPSGRFWRYREQIDF